MRTFILCCILACLAAFPAAQRPAARGLEMYLIDVEGGNATLFVAPSGQSLLIDTGNGGAAAARDADRIAAAVRDAGLQQIDHLITTHYHGDHFGGMAALAERVPIRHFIAPATAMGRMLAGGQAVAGVGAGSILERACFS